MMIGWMTGEGKSWEDRASVREQRSRKNVREGGKKNDTQGSSKKGCQIRTKRKKRRRKKKTDAGDSNERNHNMLTVRRKHKRWMSREEMREKRERKA